ncbi:MAG: POTRA domain-containing protein, partial [Bacteroidota bacterium]
MKRLSAILLVFITSFLSYHSTTYAQSDQQKEYTIKEITVSGIQFLDPNAIINLSGLKIGDKLRIPSTDAATAIKKLWKTGLFGDVSVTVAKVEGDDIFLDINLQERPKVTRISFDGVRKGQQTTLSEKLGTIKGTVVSDATLKNAELTIKKYYAEK